MAQQTEEKAVVHIVKDAESLRRLSLAGLHTRTFSSAQEIIDAKREDVAAWLALDVRLPDSRGLDAQAQLAALGVHPPVSLVIIVITTRPACILRQRL